MTSLEQIPHLLGVCLTPRQREQLLTHLDLLRTHQSAGLNLVSPKDLPRLLPRHTLDSLAALSLLPASPDLHVLDLGSGAGFPGVPIGVARPDLRVDLLESSRPRALFLRKLLRVLELPNLRVLHARAEDLANAYPVVLARAFAPLSRLLPLAASLLLPTGLLIAYKGPRFRAELSSIPTPCPLLLARCRSVSLPPLPPTVLLLFRKAPHR